MRFKKAISFVLTALLVTSVFAVPVSASNTSKYYSDVYTSDPFYSAVNYLHEHGIIFGTTENKYSPEKGLTRAQVVTILWRMLHKPEPSGTVQVFSDCKQGTSYYDAVRWASSSDVAIVAGFGDGTFKPTNNVSNQEAMSFLYRFAAYCRYISNSTDARNEYRSAFEASSLTNKSTFASWAKIPAGWAYQNGFIFKQDIAGNATENRGEIAQQIYNFYKCYQKKYGMAVVNSSKMPWGINCDKHMRNLFVHYGAYGANAYDNITKANFESAMQFVFSNAKPLDICYLYCASHGGTSGLALFTDGKTLTPAYLRQRIDLYDGTFVTFISGCHSGTFVTKSGEEKTDVFDANAFTTELLNNENSIIEGGELRGSNRIKVLCSSAKDELSYSTNRYATRYWCLGSGYDYIANPAVFTTLYADTNLDSRISLNELYQYSHDKILASNLNQHVVCCPELDNFIIFESGY